MSTMNQEARDLVKKRLKPEASKIILAVDDYLTCKEDLDAQLKDCRRPIAEGRQFLAYAQAYIAALRSAKQVSELESKIDYLKSEARETIKQSIPYHYERLSNEEEYADIMRNGLAAANPTHSFCQVPETSLKL